jgi:hypothetical protein
MAISAGDLTRLEGESHRSRAYFSVWKREVVATAQINQTTFDYPLGELTVDNTSAAWLTDVRIGQQFSIGTTAGDDDVTVGIIRKTPLASTIFIDGKSRGDPGVASAIAVELADDQFITVYNYYPLWTMLSRIFEGQFFKQFDLPYTDEGSDPDPVVVMGEWRWGFVEPGTSTINFAFDAGNSFAWGTKTVSTYLWTLPVEATIISGTVNSSALTISLPVNPTPLVPYLIECQITDSASKTANGLRPVWVWDRSGINAPFNVTNHQVLITDDNQNLNGRRMSLEFYGDRNLSISEATVAPGAAFIYAEEATFDGIELTAGTLVDTYVGYTSEERRRGQFNRNTLNVSLVSPYERLAEIPMVSQLILEADSPSNWTEISRGLGDPNFVVWYVLKHHCPNMLLMHDFIGLPDATPPRKRNYGLNGQTVQAQLKETARLVAGNIGSSSDGSLYFLRNPNVEQDAFRAAMDTLATIVDRHLQGEVEFPFKYHANVGGMFLYCFIYTGDDPIAFGALAPGRAQAQAPGRENSDTLIVLTVEEGEEKAGDLLAIANDPTPSFRLFMNRNFDVFDPAKHYNIWVGFNIGARFDVRGGGFIGRGIVESVSRSWVPTPLGNYVKEVRLTFVGETDGVKGVEVPLSRGAMPTQNPDNPEPEDFDDNLNFLIMIG